MEKPDVRWVFVAEQNFRRRVFVFVFVSNSGCQVSVYSTVGRKPRRSVRDVEDGPGQDGGLRDGDGARAWRAQAASA